MMLNLKKFNQEHLLQYYDEINLEERKILLDQINKIDFKLMNQIYKNSYFDEKLDMKKK